MFVYSKQKSERLSFVLKVLSEHLSIPFDQTQNLLDVKEGDTFINYSSGHLENSLWIIPEGFLFETKIRGAAIPINEDLGLLFPTSEEKAYPFDILSSIFYMLSRYEEYLPYKGDSHGRFCSVDSIAYRLNSLRTAFVDRWIIELGERLSLEFQQFPSYCEYQYIPTIDVDIAFAYRHRPLWLTLANYFRDFAKRDFAAIAKRFRVNVGLLEDPYNTFELLKNKYKQQKAHIFFQVGERGEFDKNISPFHPEMRKLIYSCKQWANIGIHPSYASNSDQEKLKIEMETLARITNEKTSTCRQHFLKLSFPDTYQHLLSHGIEQDFTLGFADNVGFRAGTSHSFPFFDLENERITKLRLIPLSIMDGTLKSYLKLNIEEAKEVTREVITEVKNVNGTFVSLWHNTSFSEIDDWNNWLELFTFMHEEAIK